MSNTSPIPPLSSAPANPVLMYDGECGLCNAAVRFLLRIDRRERLHFAPLQGSAAQGYLFSRGLPTRDFDSMILIPDWPPRQEVAPRFRTDAALAALQAIGGAWGMLAAVLRVIPAPLRDFVYRLIARFRYQIFGPYRPKPLPHPKWAQRFLA